MSAPATSRQFPASQLPPPPDATAIGEEWIKALDGTIPPVRIGFAYQFGLLAVTLMMLLLPIFYITLIGLAAYGIYWHAIHDVGVLGIMGRGRAGLIAIFIYLAPIIVGGLLVTFMIKPLFAKRARRFPPLTLSRSQQRILYTFVDKLCGLVGARRPYRIDVDCQVNASAGFRDGTRGLLSGELVLTIGLPLMAGMTASQFAGVLAHEFGHFTQGTGMRLTFIVRSINAWFARVVYERDAWDEWLIGMAHNDSHWTITIIAHLSRLMVWVTRRILWILMWTGHLVSSFMLRQMEFDADRYEARIAGSDTFAHTCQRLMMLNASQSAAFSDLGDAWREKRLCDDLTRLVLARENTMPTEVRDAIRKNTAGGTTGWFDSHPSNADRIASAFREQAPGIFRQEGPATSLLNDFEQLSRQATELFYREQIGPAFQPDFVVKTEAIVAQTNNQEEAGKSLRRFFQGLIQPVRPVFPSRQSQPVDADAAAELLLAARNKLLDQVQTAREAVQNFQKLDEQLMGAIRLQAKARAGEISSGSQDLVAARQSIESPRGQALGTLNKILHSAMVRVQIIHDLSLREKRASTPASGTSQSGDYDLADTGAPAPLESHLDSLATLARAADKIELLRRDFYAFDTILALFKPAGNSPELISLALQRSKQLHQLLNDLHAIMRETKYPYSHAERGISISRFMTPQMPAPDAIGQIHRAAQSTLDSFYNLYYRLMSDVAHEAEIIERSLGFDPLPDPQPAPP